MTTKTVIDLMREYVRVADMCKGTDVKPWECVRIRGLDPFKSTPMFNHNPDQYEFAIAILEEKPVFVGNKLYCGNEWYTVRDGGYSLNDDKEIVYFNWNDINKAFSWHPPKPKRTFEINGEELPCPVKIPHQRTFVYEVNGIDFHFDSHHDLGKWDKEFARLLTAARDKE